MDRKSKIIGELRELGAEVNTLAPIETLEAKLRELKVKRAAKGGMPDLENRPERSSEKRNK